jgi:5-methylcytosine-specific restriction protein A
MSTTRRTKGIFASPPPKNEKGEKVCRNCHGPLKSKSKHNCSTKCSEQWALKTSPGLMRLAVSNRDKGICGECGVDTVARRKEFNERRLALKAFSGDSLRKLAAEYGMGSTAQEAHWWEADHIVPVIEGGGECGLEGYRTLCISCHKKATKELRGRMSTRRREQKAIENDRAGLFADQVEA